MTCQQFQYWLLVTAAATCLASLQQQLTVAVCKDSCSALYKLARLHALTLIGFTAFTSDALAGLQFCCMAASHGQMGLYV